MKKIRSRESEWKKERKKERERENERHTESIVSGRGRKVGLECEH